MPDYSVQNWQVSNADDAPITYMRDGERAKARLAAMARQQQAARAEAARAEAARAEAATMAWAAQEEAAEAAWSAAMAAVEVPLSALRATAEPKSVPGAERALERARRAGEGVTAARAEAATMAARIAEHERSLERVAILEQSMHQHVQTKERTLATAEQRMIDARAAALLAIADEDGPSEGGDMVAAAEARAAAQVACDEARAALEQIRQQQGVKRAAIQHELVTARAALAETHALIVSLEHMQRAAQHEAGVAQLRAAQEWRRAHDVRVRELRLALIDACNDLDVHQDEVQAIGAAHPELQASREYAELTDDRRPLREMGEAYLAFLDAVTRWRGHPEASAAWWNGANLPMLVHDVRLPSRMIESILGQDGELGPLHGVIYSVRGDLARLLVHAAQDTAAAIAEKPTLETLDARDARGDGQHEA